jgi:hypothetical protein
MHIVGDKKLEEVRAEKDAMVVASFQMTISLL